MVLNLYVQALKILDTTATDFSTTINSFEITSTNASPASVNGLSSPYTTETIAIPTGNYTLVFPETGNITVGPFTSGTTLGDQMYIGIGDANAVVNVFNSAGSQIDTVTVACTPPSPLNFIGLLITNSTPTAASST